MKIRSAKRPAVVYVPKACGNREAPRAEQLRVTIEPLSVAEYETLRAAELGKSDDAREIARAVKEAIIASRVVSVFGLDADPAQGEMRPGEWLVKAVAGSNNAEHGVLLDEILSAVLSESVLLEGAAKN